jgi:hypothetical protein
LKEKRIFNPFDCKSCLAEARQAPFRYGSKENNNNKDMEEKRKSTTHAAPMEGQSYKEIIDDYYCWQQEEADLDDQKKTIAQATLSETGKEESGETDI